jgi:hypothetical protein
MLPFIIGAIGAGAVGIGKSIKAGMDSKKAERLNRNAGKMIEDAKVVVEAARFGSGVSLNALGSKKVFVLDDSMTRFLKSFRKLKNVDFESSVGLDELGRFRMDKQAVVELRKLSHYAASIAGGVASGVLGGALTGFAAYGGTMLFATASTGTAISALSGVAATNATLAFLGGGALAAGGLGVAGGIAVLGGLIAGPALAVMGFIVGAKAKANLEKARSNYAEAEEASEQMLAAAALCNAVRRRSYLFYRLLIRLDCVFAGLVEGLEAIIKRRGKNYANFKPEEKHTVAESMAIAASIKAVLDTPILTDAGKLTSASRMIAMDVHAAMEKKAGIQGEVDFTISTEAEDDGAAGGGTDESEDDGAGSSGIGILL